MQRPRPTPQTPLPGTVRAPRALFVGRWGALIERDAGAPPRTLNEARLAPAAEDALFRATQAGWRLYLVGNEPAVARGRLGETHWRAFERELVAHLARLGVPVARDYACLDHPDGRGERKRDSVFRFPNTGAFHHARQEDGVDLATSWLVSDDLDELVAASRAGVRTLLLGSVLRCSGVRIEVECDQRAGSLVEAIDAILCGDPLRRIG
jgi:histidinol phosphatase-like enzyme